MDPQEIFANLPRAKEDKPLLFSFAPIQYSRTDTDGLHYMLDRDFSGCLLLTFAKPMNPEIQGKATLNSEPLPKCFLKHMPIMANMWVLGIPLRGYVDEYGKEYLLHVEGYADMDGNIMDPQDFTVKCLDRVLPQSKDAAHEAIALQSAEEGTVLLKNSDNVLPLAKDTTLNLFGKGVGQFRTSAVGAGKINPRYTIDFLEALRESSEFKLNEELVQFYRSGKDAVPSEELIRAAKANSSVAIMMITRGTGENLDNSTKKGEFYLSDDEDTLLQTLTKEFASVIAILNVGYPIDVSWAEKYQVKALIYSGFGGMFGGKALVNILDGTVNPSGKLPDTWAKDYFDIPASLNFYNCVDKIRLNSDDNVYVDTCYEEDIYVGYRYFSTFGKSPAFPFGYGLSYTRFSIAANLVAFRKELKISYTVQNTGTRAGKEIVQVYIGKPDGAVETPARELVYFGKTKELQPGEAQVLEATIPEQYYTVYDVKKAAFVLPAGNYTVFLGTDANAPECGQFAIEVEKTVKQVSHLMLAPQPPEVFSQTCPEASFPKGNRSGVKDGVASFLPQAIRKVFPPQFNGKKPHAKLLYKDMKEDPSLIEDFVAQMTVEELARVSICGAAGWGMQGVGEAGHIVEIEGYGLPYFPVSDGNSGVNLTVPNIGFPSGVTLTASFNVELMQEVGRVIGEEAKALGMPLILAPGMNLHRNPLNGRQPEYFSEDPHLAGIMAGYYCKGLESTGVGSCIKHLIGNNCESSRKRNQSIIGERALRELYLKPFEIAMSVHMPATVMTGYNAVNGCHTAADEELIQGFLREENGFDGFVMTDWESYDTVSVPDMIKAGNCWITPGTLDDTFTKPIVENVANGQIPLARLQENVTWMIRTLVRFST